MFVRKLVVFLFLNQLVFGQDTIPETKDSTLDKLKFEAYLDVYYGFNAAQTNQGEIPYFVSMNRENELSLNLAYLSVSFITECVRSKFTPAVGSYMNSNYASEKETFKNVLEANVGFKLTKNKNLWLDVGILGSPYTNENAITCDHISYSRSLAAEYVPYYLCGAKFSMSLSKKLNAYLYLLNGWQQIHDVNKSKSIGTQLEYKASSKHLFNWNTYFGNEKSELNPSYRNRFFTDLFWTYNLDGKTSFSSCIYLGLQEKTTSSYSKNAWYQGNFLARYNFTSKTSLSARIEYFKDNNEILLQSINPDVNQFDAFGASLGLNIRIDKRVLFRLESRYFKSSRNIFVEKNNFVNYNYWFLSSLVFRFIS